MDNFTANISPTNTLVSSESTAVPEVVMAIEACAVLTHTDQCLQWSSNHPVHHKLGIVRTLMHHTETLIKDEGRVKIEKEKVRVALRDCSYPDWALKEGEQLGKRE